MTTASRRYPLSIHTHRFRAGGTQPKARRQRSRGVSEEPAFIPLMGPANHAPAVPIMGVPGRSRHAAMGGHDAAPHSGVLGLGDRGTRTDLFGDGDSSFVDFLFTPRDTDPTTTL
jgi:hypothetical protein